MPLVTVTLRKDRTAAYRRSVLDVVHRALVAAGVPPEDRFQRVLGLEPGDFVYDERYPDLAAPRGEGFVLIEILFSVGRSVKVKRRIVADIVADLAREAGARPQDVMIVFKETAWENWAFAEGRLLHAA